MKKYVLSLLSLVTAAAFAQAPDSISGMVVAVEVTSGTGQFADQGFSGLRLKDDGTFILIGDENIENAEGTYTYTKVDDDDATLVLNTANRDVGSVVTYEIDFDDETTGDLSADESFGRQRGDFQLYTLGQALAADWVTIDNYPYAYSDFWGWLYLAERDGTLFIYSFELEEWAPKTVRD